MPDSKSGVEGRVGSTPTEATLKEEKNEMMKIIKIDEITIQCAPAGTRYSCYIFEHDLYFSSKVNDEEMIIKKARFMVESKARFLNDFPQYKVAN